MGFLFNKGVNMFKTILSILLLISFIYSSPSDTLDYRQQKRRKAPAAYLDVSSGAQRVIPVENSAIHNYMAYSIGVIDTLGDDEVLGLVFYIPEGVIFHLKFAEAWAEGSPFLLNISHNPDTTRLSVYTLIPCNRNQAYNKGNTLFSSQLTVTDSVDTMGSCTIVDQLFFGGGSGIGGSSFSGSAPLLAEWIFSNDYVYVTIQNISGDTKKASLFIFWCECYE